MKYLEKKYSDEELLENTYYFVSENEQGNYDVETVRVIKKTEDSVYIITCVLDPKIDGVDVFYAPSVINKDEFEEYFISAEELIDDSYKCTLVNDGKIEQIMFFYDGAIGFFKSQADENVVIPLDVDKTIDSYYDSPNFSEELSGSDIAFATQMVLKNIKITKLFENDYMNDTLIENIRENIIALTEPEKLTSPENTIKEINRVLSDLKSGNFELIKEAVDKYFQVLENHPLVMLSASEFIKNKYNKNISFDPYDKNHVLNLSIPDKKFILQGYIELGLEQGIFLDKVPNDAFTISKENEEFLEDYYNSTSKTLTILQKEMGLIDENENQYLDKKIKSEEDKEQEKQSNSNDFYLS